MIKSFLAVGLGGAAGSMARYGVSYLISKYSTTAFPLGTFLINITGCLLIGILFGLGQRNAFMQGTGWLLLASGFCGGFTTFSAFALENINLVGKQAVTTSLLYTCLSVFLGLILCRVGIALAK